MNKKIGLVGRLAGYFVSNRQIGLLSVIVLLFWGFLGFILMPKQYNPEITAPAFNVITGFSGSSSNEVYELITRPMESKIKEIPSVDKVFSQSLDGGMSIVTVQFFVGENIEDAKISLMQKLESNMDFKPLGAGDPQIKEINPDDVPVVVFSLTSDSHSEETLRKITWDIGDELKEIDDISKIEVKGGRKKQISIRLDAGKLSSFGISIDQVMGVIQSNNNWLYAGNVEGERGNFRVIVDGNINDINELNQLIIKTNNGAKILRLADIASVSYDTGEIKSYVNFSDKQSNHSAVFLALSKKKGTNATVVSDEINNKIEEIKKGSLVNGIDINLVLNDGEVARDSVFKLTSNLFTSIVIVALVLLVFLGWRSALVVSVAIPLTLASVFGLGVLFDQTINRITLFALILSLGLLVDNATVVVENVYRLLREKRGENEDEIIAGAVDEVGVSLIMSTITTVLAFYPMNFVTGMMGPYMKPIPFFVPVALVASLFIAFTINPFLLKVFLPKAENINKKKNPFLSFMERVNEKYSVFLKSLIDNKLKRKKILMVVAVAFSLSVLLPIFGIVKFRMLPKDDKDQFYIYIDLPSQSSINITNGVVQKLEQLLVENQNVASVQGFIGESSVVDFNGLFKGSSSRVGENQATLKVNLIGSENREETSEELVFDFRDKLKGIIQNYPDTKIKLVEDPPGPPVLSTFLIKIQGNDYAYLTEMTKDIEEKVTSIDGVVDIDDSLSEQGVEYVFGINKEKANLSGISSEQIVSTLGLFLHGKSVGLYHESSNSDFRKPEQELVIVSVERKNRDEVSDLDNILIENNKGKKIPITELIYKKKANSFPIIFSSDQKKTTYISAEMGDRSVIYATIDVLKSLLKYELPSKNSKITSWSLFGVNYIDLETGKEYEISLDGEWKLTLEVFRDLGIAMLIAVLFIYFVLVFQFQSLRLAALIMGTIPLVMIGVLPGFAILGWTRGIFFNATSMIGVIALAGIVVNNAIILLEYIEEMRRGGESLEQAILDSGKTRFLPIVLTSLTTILGSLTIVSDPVWSGLAWSIIFGLSVATFLTLIIFPVLYYITDRNIK